MTKRPNHLKRYADRYRVTRREDGVWYILTRYPDHKLGMTYDVYDYDDTRLAACLPPGAARSLLKRFPEAFTEHQKGLDGTVLLFEENKLHDLADVLKLRRRRRLSEEHKAKLMASNVHTRFGHGSEREKMDPEPEISVRGG